MLRHSVLVLAGATLAMTACARATPPAAELAPAPAPAVVAVDPAGRWTVGLVAQGQMYDFVMELRPTGEGIFGGSVTSEAFPPMSITGAVLTANRLKFSVLAPTGDNATFDIVFEGDTFTGDWAMPGDGSRVSGRRIP